MLLQTKTNSEDPGNITFLHTQQRYENNRILIIFLTYT